MPYHRPSWPPICLYVASGTEQKKGVDNYPHEQEITRRVRKSIELETVILGHVVNCVTFLGGGAIKIAPLLPPNPVFLDQAGSVKKVKLHHVFSGYVVFIFTVHHFFR